MKYSSTIQELDSAAREFFAGREEIFENTLQVICDSLQAGGKI